MESIPGDSEKGVKVLRNIACRLVFSYGMVRWYMIRDV
jgi:hypothetical protein